MRLEEQPVHVGQLHFVIVKEEQLRCTGIKNISAWTDAVGSYMNSVKIKKKGCITLPMPHLVSISAVTLPTPPTPTTATANVLIFC